HGGEGGLEHGIVAFVLEAELAQHRAHCDVDGAAGRVGHHHLALEVLDLFDRAVGEHHILLRVIPRYSIPELVRDHAQIVHPGIISVPGTLPGTRGVGKRRNGASDHGETSSSTRPLVSIANRPVMIAATAATAPNARNTRGTSDTCAGVSRGPIISPTTVGPIIEANRSQAVAVPTPKARTRVG